MSPFKHDLKTKKKKQLYEWRPKINAPVLLALTMLKIALVL